MANVFAAIAQGRDRYWRVFYSAHNRFEGGIYAAQEGTANIGGHGQHEVICDEDLLAAWLPCAQFETAAAALEMLCDANHLCLKAQSRTKLSRESLHQRVIAAPKAEQSWPLARILVCSGGAQSATNNAPG
jgi:hypothetical protein